MAIKVRRGKLYPPVEIDYAKSLGLDEVEWERIVDRLGRAPNHFECSIFAALWSEEVSDKSSAALLEAIEREMPEIRTVPGTPIGLVELAEGCQLALRIVNNNAQTLVDPFYAAQTAIDSAIEELVTLGVQPIGVLDLLRFGSTEILSNQRLLQNAVTGIGTFSSRYGIPIIGGDLYFHKRYNGSPMINAAVVGIVTNDNALVCREVPFQSPMLYVGAKTGRDGLLTVKKRGVEESLKEGEEQKIPSIKMSDPLLANRIVNACAEAIEAGVLAELVNVGTGGIAIACFDLAKRINRPVLLDIDRIPLRGSDFAPLEIILSESSERVMMVTTREQHRQLNRILDKWDLVSVKVGEVNDADGIEFYWNHYLAADLPFQFALGGAVQKSFEVVKFPPMLKRSAKSDGADKARQRKKKTEDEWSLIREVSLAKEQEDEEREIECPSDLVDTWLEMLTNPNLCSRSALYSLFDHVVGARTLQRPGGDASVMRAANMLAKDNVDDKLAVAVTVDSNALYVSMEPYLGTVQTIAEGMRNLSAVGARPIALAACMNFGNPEKYREVCDLAESVRGMGDASRIWDIPILSRQMCLNNGSDRTPAMPTPAFVMAGVLEDSARSCSIGFKNKGDRILLLGLTENEIGCTEYANYVHKFVNRLVPDINFDDELKACRHLRSLIEQGLLQSAHDLSSGGLAIALTECAMARGRPIGCEFHIDEQVFETPNGPVPLRKDAALFSETSGRFLVSCTPENEDHVRRICAESSIPVTGEGTVGGKMLRICGTAEAELPISTTYKLWVHRIESLLGQGGSEAVGF